LRVREYNSNARDFYALIKTTLSERARLEMHNRYPELFARHVNPDLGVMQRPEDLWQLVHRTMTSPENGNQYAMALAMSLCGALVARGPLVFA